MSQIGQFQLTVSPAAIVETLTGNVGGPVGPTGNNINVVGDGSTIIVTGNPGTSTLTISAPGLAETFVCNVGSATPALGIIEVIGGNNIHTDGAGNIITINVSGTTNHSLQLGNATGSLTSLGVATNGQLPIGSTGVDPVLATLTAGTNISITNGAGSITIDTTGSVADTFNGDSGSATPLAGIIVMAGGNNITTSAAGHTVTYNVSGTTNHSLQLGNVSGSLTSLGVATNGQLPIGSTGSDPVLATLTAGTNVTITNGAGSITIAAAGLSTITYTLVNTSPYVVLATDEYLGVDSSGAPITIQLPNAPATGRTFIIKDKTGSAATNNITVTTVGGVVNIDGATSFVMNTAYESINVLFDGSTYQIW